METLRNKNRTPTHPGALLREVVLPELGITQGEFADVWASRAVPCPRYCTNAVR
jgi:hypothetical protein